MMKILLLLEIYFCAHFKISKEIPAGSDIAEIPHAIYDRMCYKGTMSILSPIDDNNPDYKQIILTVHKSLSDGKYYFYSINNIKLIPSYLTCYYNLKDI